MKFETRAIRAGEEPIFKEGGSGDIVKPIHLASTFARERVEEPTGGYEYSRQSNPTRDALEEKLAAVEDARYGLAFASGMAAETVLGLSLLRTGDHVVAFNDLYGGTRRLFDRVFSDHFNIDFTYVDARSVEKVESAIRDNTRLIWLETPTNPLIRIGDIRAIADIAEERKIISIVDNTFVSPYFQSPLALGATISMHSTTKYLNGHSDSIGGAVMLNDQSLYEKLKFNQNSTGAILSPFDSFMVMRGIKTLAVRMERHSRNALAVAQYLENHPKVRRVSYPGLESHAQHELAKRQMSGFGGMLSFKIDGGLDAAIRFLEKVKLYALAESLGGVESLIEHPALMTHASVPKEERKAIGISDSLIRISVGLENIDDLLEDLEQAFSSLSS